MESPVCCAPASTTFGRDLGHNAADVVSCTSPTGVVQMRKRGPVSGRQPSRCDQISTPAENQLYPFSEHTCAHRHSHGARKLLVIGGVESTKTPEFRL